MRALTVLFLAAALSVQESEQPAIRVTVAHVLLDVTVTDRKGTPLTGLRQATSVPPRMPSPVAIPR